MIDLMRAFINLFFPPEKDGKEMSDNKIVILFFILVALIVFIFAMMWISDN